jgi:TonB family protein
MVNFDASGKQLHTAQWSFLMIRTSTSRRHATLRSMTVIVSAMLPTLAISDCVIDPARMKPVLSANALAIRNALFLEACVAAEGALVDSTDPTLASRLEQPRALKIQNSEKYYPKESRRRRIEGAARLVFVIGMDGSVSDVTIIESSGHDELDAAAVKMWQEARFGVPAKLDGQPIRALGYGLVPFTLR